MLKFTLFKFNKKHIDRYWQDGIYRRLGYIALCGRCVKDQRNPDYFGGKIGRSLLFSPVNSLETGASSFLSFLNNVATVCLLAPKPLMCLHVNFAHYILINQTILRCIISLFKIFCQQAAAQREGERGAPQVRGVFSSLKWKSWRARLAEEVTEQMYLV